MKVSEHETVATLLLEDHWQKIGIWNGWNNQQVERVARMYHCTVYELGMAAGIKRKTMSHHIKHNHFPSHLALQFKLLEDFYVSHVLKRPVPPAVPIDAILKRHD